MKYKVISTDDHLQEAPHTWTARMSAKKWGDKIPQLQRRPDGTDCWHLYGAPRAMGSVGSVHGAMPDRTKPPTRWDDVPKCAYVPAERIKAMEQDGVDVHTFFGNIAGIAGNTFQDPAWPMDYNLECIRAFNDFQLEEYDKPFPGRFITLAIVPLWDVNEAVTEVKRTHKLGIKGISIAMPQQWKHKHICDPSWDPLWKLCEETGLSVNLHIGSGGSQGYGQNPNWEGLSPMVRLATSSVRTISANTDIMGMMLLSPIPARFPKLKIVSSESGMGWVPYLLEVADHQYERQKLWLEGMHIKPSEIFHRQFYVNFWFEVIGAQQRQIIGMDNIMWESDFPHPTCTWPESQDYIQRCMKDWTPAERQQVLVDNAVRVFNLNPN